MKRVIIALSLLALSSVAAIAAGVFKLNPLEYASQYVAYQWVDQIFKSEDGSLLVSSNDLQRPVMEEVAQRQYGVSSWQVASAAGVEGSAASNWQKQWRNGIKAALRGYLKKPANLRKICVQMTPYVVERLQQIHKAAAARNFAQRLVLPVLRGKIPADLLQAISNTNGAERRYKEAGEQRRQVYEKKGYESDEYKAASAKYSRLVMEFGSLSKIEKKQAEKFFSGLKIPKSWHRQALRVLRFRLRRQAEGGQPLVRQYARCAAHVIGKLPK